MPASQAAVVRPRLVARDSVGHATCDYRRLIERSCHWTCRNSCRPITHGRLNAPRPGHEMKTRRGPRRRHHARRHAALDLHRQPVHAQFGWRHCPQSGAGARAFAGRDRAAVERVLSCLRRRPDSRGHGARSLRTADLPDGRRGHHGDRCHRVCDGGESRCSDPRPRLAGARNGGLAGVVAGGLCQAISAGSLCHAHRPAGRHRHPRHTDGDGSARVLDGHDRLAQQFSSGGGLHASGRDRNRRGRQGRCAFGSASTP